jgi:hypothetical protein
METEIEGPPIKAVELMRQIRDEINAEMEGKSFEEIRRMLDEELAKSELWQKLRKRSPTSSR